MLVEDRALEGWLVGTFVLGLRFFPRVLSVRNRVGSFLRSFLLTGTAALLKPSKKGNNKLHNPRMA